MMTDLSTPHPGSSPARPRYRYLRGSNPYSRESVLVGDFGTALNGEHVETDRLQYVLETLGLGSCPLPGAGAPPERWVEAIAANVRHHLELPPAEMEPDTLPLGAFVLPLDSPELAEPIADLALGCIAGAPDDILARQLRDVEEMQDRLFPTLDIRAMHRECRRSGVPWRSLRWSPRLQQLGEGSQQLRIDLTWTQDTSRVATSIAKDKVETADLLRQFGIPVPRQGTAASPADAWSIAQRIGVPVVVKPRFGNQSRGVSVNLSSNSAILSAAHHALQVSKLIIVESMLHGSDYRVIIAKGKILSAAMRVPAHVVGDGSHTIEELVAIENRNPLRSKSKLTVLNPIEVDAEMVRRVALQGCSLTSIPPPGETIHLRFGLNLSTGATALDVTDAIHPENAAMVIRAVGLVGLDIAGVDLIMPDVSRPWYEAGGGICEVNSRPSTRSAMAAELGTDKSVVARLLKAVYPRADAGRIPVIVVYGGDRPQFAADLAEALRKRTELRVALGTLRQASLPKMSFPIEVNGLWEAHQLMVEDPTVDLAVLEVDPNLIDTYGLGVSRADVAVIGDKAGCSGRHAGILRRTGAAMVESSDLDQICATLRRAGVWKDVPGQFPSVRESARPI